MNVTFNYVSVTEEQQALMQVLRERYQVLYDNVKMLPHNRGLSIALTKLEESSMWLNKSITENC